MTLYNVRAEQLLRIEASCMEMALDIGRDLVTGKKVLPNQDMVEEAEVTGVWKV